MILLALLGLLLDSAYSVTLTYPTDITAFDISYKNPDKTGDETVTGPTAAQAPKLTDGASGESFILDFVGNSRVWGTQGNTVGLSGTFSATTLNPGASFKAWSITKAQIQFKDCFDADKATASVSYDNLNGAKQILDDATLTSENGIYTFTANIPAAGIVTNGAVTFEVTSGKYCEGEISIVEFILEGTKVATDEPTLSPTTKEPTMAPTAECRGELTWGDPHYTLMPMAKKTKQFHYQGKGWHYYLFPCDTNLYDEWPFFLLSYHKQCNGAKSCISNNALIINTKPDPWIVYFQNSYVKIISGTDAAGQKASDFNLDKGRKIGSKERIEIKYNDGQTNPKSGRLVIFMQKSEVVVQLHDVRFDAHPRTCAKGTKSGSQCGEFFCEGPKNYGVIDIRNKNSYTSFSCPTCLRNLACGLMGKYTRGDCTDKMLADPNHACYNILVGSDGKTYTPPKTATFVNMATTWKKSVVDNVVTGAGKTKLPNLLKSHELAGVSNMRLRKEGRSIDVTDPDFYDGDCKGNWEKIRNVNATCRANTFGKYGDCCEQIGICDLLQFACIEDFCACTAANSTGQYPMTEQQCVQMIDSDINATCSDPKNFPTATPTAAPTRSPTGLIAGLPKGKKAEDLIWLYLIFVVLFVVIAGAAFWYYKKKNKGSHSFKDDDEEMQGVNVPSADAAATFTAA